MNLDQVVSKLLLLLRYRDSATLSPLEKPSTLSPLGEGPP
jgi:hypothetical protein